MPTYKTNIKSLPINVIVVFFDGLLVNRTKSSQIAFGGRPSRPQQRDFAPLPPRIWTLCNEPPPLSPLPGNPAKSHLIVVNPDRQVHGNRPDRRTDSELLIRRTVLGGRGRSLLPNEVFNCS
ncbi:MAG: hypothetical protein P4L50_00780 [Anaerolineaceae bacterium]|nr:hypothetical protein [Anaerolineaceae bacterium]